MPSLLAMVVPNGVDEPLSYTVTVAPASAPRPVILGLSAVVIRSPKVPVSLALSSTGALRLAALTSTSTATALE